MRVAVFMMEKAKRQVMLFVLVAVLSLVIILSGCAKKDVCTMTNGPDTFSSGSVSFNGQTYQDTCNDENTVTSYYCSDNTTKEQRSFCEFGCEDGACRENALVCGGYKNISCDEGYGCDYSETLAIEEFGLCKKGSEVTTITSQTDGNYSLRCVTKDRTYFIRNQVMYYTNGKYDIVLSNTGEYVRPIEGGLWTLYPWMGIRKREYVSAVWAIHQKKNVQGPIECFPVGYEYHPEIFKRFIDTHPFLYRKVTADDIQRLNLTTVEEQLKEQKNITIEEG